MVVAFFNMPFANHANIVSTPIHPVIVSFARNIVIVLIIAFNLKILLISPSLLISLSLMLLIVLFLNNVLCNLPSSKIFPLLLFLDLYIMVDTILLLLLILLITILFFNLKLFIASSELRFLSV